MTDAERVLVEQNLPLLGYLARQFSLRQPRFEYDDLYQEGFFGLVRAVETFDPGKGDFGPWASWKILGHMTEYIRRWAHTRQHTAERVAWVEEAHAPIEDESGYEDAEAMIDCDRLEEVLSSRERRIFQLRLIEDKSLHEVAAEFGVSESRISQIYSRACTKMSQAA